MPLNYCIEPNYFKYLTGICVVREVKSTNMTRLEPQPDRLLMKKKLDVYVTTFGEELICHSVHVLILATLR